MPTDAEMPTLIADMGATEPRPVIGDRYELLGLLGAGGMGTVYRARDREIDEIVAVKVLRPELLGAPGALERFRRELKLARRVTHPNVARVFDLSEHQGNRIITMELVDGEPLAALLVQKGQLSLARALEIAGAVATGVGAAHAAGVVHRDLKPDNVLLAKDGRVLVADFGVARAASGDAARTGGGFIGTPMYMAPEQLEAPGSVDHRADIFSFGAMLYEMLVGAPPFAGEGVFAIAAARLLQPAPDPRSVRPDLPSAIAGLVVRCMARSPDARPASMAAIAGELAGITLPGFQPSLAPRNASPLAAPQGRRVAVLPFANFGPAEQQYVADALAEDLIDLLSVAKGLRVRAYGAVRRLTTPGRDPRDIGRELDVDVVVEGSVRRLEDGFRVTARLLSVVDGFQLWARRFALTEVELLSNNDAVARAVAEALGAELETSERKEAPNGEAVDAYLRAREANRWLFTSERSKVVELFARAFELAPDDPRVMSGYAVALLRAWGMQDQVDLAHELVDRALRLAPGLPDAHVAAAQMAFNRADWPAAVLSLRRALRLAPGHVEAHDTLGRILIETDSIAGRRHLEVVLAAEPEHEFARVSLARHYFFRGDRARAFALLEDADGHMIVPMAWARFVLWMRDRERGVKVLELLIARTPQAEVGRQLLRSFLFDEPTSFGETRADPALPHHPLVAFLAQVQAEMAGLRGERRTTLDALARADQAGFIDSIWLKACPLFDFVREDPEFQAVGARVDARVAAIHAAYTAPQTS